VGGLNAAAIIRAAVSHREQVGQYVAAAHAAASRLSTVLLLTRSIECRSSKESTSNAPERRTQMALQIVMDSSGDSRFEFDPADGAAVSEAMERFEVLTAAGYTAAERTGPGTSRKVTEFDPTAAEVLFMPRLVGG
jgi:hypothetical protein